MYNRSMNRPQTEAFIHENFAGIIQDYPWNDTPEYTVFRHADNRKWFALIANVNYRTLGLDQEENVDFINLKCDPDLLEELLHEPGVLPAYHMNKRHWLTITLDGRCADERLKSLIDLSYQLTARHHNKKS